MKNEMCAHDSYSKPKCAYLTPARLKYYHTTPVDHAPHFGIIDL